MNRIDPIRLSDLLGETDGDIISEHLEKTERRRAAVRKRRTALAVLSAACAVLIAFAAISIPKASGLYPGPSVTRAGSLEMTGDQSGITAPSSQASTADRTGTVWSYPLLSALYPNHKPEDGDDLDGRHIADFYTLDFDFIYILLSTKSGTFDRDILQWASALDAGEGYFALFGGTEDYNYGALSDYYGVTEEEFAEAVRIYLEISGADPDSFAEYNYVLANYKLLFGDYENEPAFLRSNPRDDFPASVTHVPENNVAYTRRFFTVDGRLIALVGESEFTKFEKKYAGTYDFNIINFIDYFNVSRSDYETLFADPSARGGRYIYPYDPDRLFGVKPEDMTQNVIDGFTRHAPDRIGASQSDLVTPVTPDGKHVAGFFTAYTDLIAYIPGTDGKLPEYLKNTEDVHPGAFIDRYCLDEAEYAEIVRRMREDKKNGGLTDLEFSRLYPHIDDYSLWTSADRESDPRLILPGFEAPETDTVTLRPEGDDVHTDRYFTIDGCLIEYVGADRFLEYKKTTVGSPDFNILTFISRFGLTRWDVIAAFSQYRGFDGPPYPYCVDRLFGTDSQRDEYLLRLPVRVEITHPIPSDGLVYKPLIARRTEYGSNREVLFSGIYEYAFDSLGRVTEEKKLVGDRLIAYEKREYDSMNGVIRSERGELFENLSDQLRVTVTDTVIKYDERGNAVCRRDTVGGEASPEITLEYEYGAEGEIVLLREYIGDSASPELSKTVSYTRDSDGRITEEIITNHRVGNSVINGYSYDSRGKPILETRRILDKNGTVTGDISVSKEYDEGGNIIRSESLDKLRGILRSTKYQYDIRGALIRVDCGVVNPTSGAQHLLFTVEYSDFALYPAAASDAVLPAPDDGYRESGI